MRNHRSNGYRNGYGYHGMYGNVMSAGGNITVNNSYVTNFTQVTTVAQVSHHGKQRPKNDRRGGYGGRDDRPKLQHFYETCGLADQGTASRMGDSELMMETANVVGYNLRAAGRDVCNIGGDLKGMAGGVCKMVTSTFGFFASLFK